MWNYNQMKIQLITCLLALLKLTLGEHIPNPQQKVAFIPPSDLDPLEKKILTNSEMKKEETLENSELQKMKPWVVEELQEYKDEDMVITKETFAFQLRKEQSFRWNPSKQGEFKIIVEVFDEQRGDIYIPQHPDSDNFVEVLIKPEGATAFKSLGKVYIKKIFTVKFYRDYQTILLKNNYDEQMLVQIGLSDTGIIPSNGIKDTLLQEPSQRMGLMLKQIQQSQVRREKLFRSHFSFKDREQRHQSQMLVFTGVQLLVIFITSIIQVYCIKNLLENRSIV